MKNIKDIIISIFAIIGILSINTLFAQGETFEFESVPTGKQKEEVTIFSGQYIVIKVDGDVDELFQKTLDWIGEIYVSSEDVITTDPRTSFIKINGITNLTLRSPSVIAVNRKVKYYITYKFKENKIKMEIKNLEAYQVSTPSTAPYWFSFNDVVTIKKNGKFREKGYADTVIVSNLFNGLANNLKSYINNTESKEGNDDW